MGWSNTDRTCARFCMSSLLSPNQPNPTAERVFGRIVLGLSKETKPPAVADGQFVSKGSSRTLRFEGGTGVAASRIQSYLLRRYI